MTKRVVSLAEASLADLLALHGLWIVAQTLPGQIRQVHIFSAAAMSLEAFVFVAALVLVPGWFSYYAEGSG